MSYTQNAPWTPSEKVDLLVNVLRSTIPDLPFFLMQVLHEKGIYPKWNDTPLPAGRSLASSQIIYEEMGRPFKQQGPYNVQPIGISHVPTIAPALPGRRPYSEFESYNPQQAQQQQQQQQQRTLQPRPPRSTDSPIPTVTNGEGSSIIRTVALPEPVQEPTRKKRGRPSKEEAEERDRALAAEGKVYQPKKRPAKKLRPSLDTPLSARTSDVAPIIAQTPPLYNTDTRQGNSGGKRTAEGQPLVDDTHYEEPVEEHLESPQPEPGSPSDRLLAPHRERDLDILLSRNLTSPVPETIAKADEREPQ